MYHILRLVIIHCTYESCVETFFTCMTSVSLGIAILLTCNLHILKYLSNNKYYLIKIYLQNYSVHSSISNIPSKFTEWILSKGNVIEYYRNIIY